MQPLIKFPVISAAEMYYICQTYKPIELKPEIQEELRQKLQEELRQEFQKDYILSGMSYSVISSLSGM